MSYEQILFDVKNQVAVITLNRPERLNAFTGQMMQEFLDTLQKVEDNDDLRVSIVTGAGRGFCAGADLAGGGRTFDLSQREESNQTRQRDPGFCQES